MDDVFKDDNELIKLVVLDTDGLLLWETLGETVVVCVVVLLLTVDLELVVVCDIVLLLDIVPVVVFDKVGVLEFVVLAVCEAETVDVLDTDELSDIEPDTDEISDADTEGLAVLLFVIEDVNVVKDDFVSLGEIEGLLDTETEFVSVYEIVLADDWLPVLLFVLILLNVFVVVTVLVTPVGNVVILVVGVLVLVKLTDTVFVLDNRDDKE